MEKTEISEDKEKYLLSLAQTYDEVRAGTVELIALKKLIDQKLEQSFELRERIKTLTEKV